MVTSRERYVQLYEEWKQKFSAELTSLFGVNNEEEIDYHFLLTMADSFIFDSQTIDAKDGEDLVSEIKEGQREISEQEWIAVSRYVMSIDFIS